MEKIKLENVEIESKIHLFYREKNRNNKRSLVINKGSDEGFNYLVIKTYIKSKDQYFLTILDENEWSVFPWYVIDSEQDSNIWIEGDKDNLEKIKYISEEMNNE